MRNIILFILITLVFTQCKKDSGDFELAYSVEFDIPAGIPPFPFQNVEVEVPNFNVEQRFANAGFTADDISTINTRSLRFDILTGVQDFAFLEQAYMEIRTNNLPDQLEIGYLEFVPNNQGNTLDLIPSLPNVVDYIKDGNFILIFKMDPRYTTTQPTRVRLYLSFDAFVE